MKLESMGLGKNKFVDLTSVHALSIVTQTALEKSWCLKRVTYFRKYKCSKLG